MKTLLAITLLVFGVAACGGTVGLNAPGRTQEGSSSPALSSAPAAADNEATITVRDFTLEPKNMSVQGAFALAVTNAGPTIHNVSIRDASGTVVNATKDLKTGQGETLRVDIPAGAYTLFCSLPGHESLGIKGTLTVTR